MLVPPNLVKFFLFFIFASPENFMCLACVVKKFEFWLPCLEGTPQFGTPKFYLYFRFTYLKNFMCLASRLKSLNFGGPRLGETSIVAPPIFVRCSLFLISIHCKNLVHLAVTVLSSKLWRTRLRGSPQPGTSDSVAH